MACNNIIMNNTSVLSGYLLQSKGLRYKVRFIASAATVYAPSLQQKVKYIDLSVTSNDLNEYVSPTFVFINTVIDCIYSYHESVETQWCEESQSKVSNIYTLASLLHTEKTEQA